MGRGCSRERRRFVLRRTASPGPSGFIVEVNGDLVARIVVAPGQVERCRAAAVAAADAATTSEHPALVLSVEAPWDIGPMVGERQLVYEAPAKN